MNVLHITNNYPTREHPIFGIFVKEQIESLNTVGINSEVLFINGREKGKKEYLKSFSRIRKKLNSKNYDVVHCHHALSAICLILSGKAKNNNIVISFQNDPIHEYGKTIFKLIKKKSKACIFKNNSNFISDKHSFYLPNGVNTSFFKPMNKEKARELLKLDNKTIFVLFVSSNKIRKQKRYDRFLEVLSILKTNYNYQNIEEIKLINTKRDEIPLYLNAVDVHLLTSDFEGSPNSVKECMACNTPVVSTNVGNVGELLDGMNGSYVAKDNSAKELAMLVDKALTQKLTNGIEQLGKLELNINSVAIKLKNIYKQISDQR